MPYALAKAVEPLPDKYSVTTFMRKSKLNLVIVKPLRLDVVSNLRGSLYVQRLKNGKAMLWTPQNFQFLIFPGKSQAFFS